MSKGKQGKFSGGGWSGGTTTTVYQAKTYCYVKDRSGDFWEAGRYFCEDLQDGGLEPDGRVVVDKGKKTEEHFDYYLVDANGEVWRKTGRGGVNSCVYDATKKAREMLGFGSFTQADKTFFSNHAKVDTGGVSRNNVLDVVSGLLIPWGYGISKVWVPRETPINDSHRLFRDLLGCNPLALATSSTTNDEFVKEMEWTPEQVEEHLGKFYWEYADLPGTPSVVMHSFSATAKSGTSAQARGGAGGHADFVGPRGSIPSDWKIAFAIDRIEHLPYDVSKLDHLLDPEMHEGYKELSIWQCKFRGKTASEHRSAKVETTPVHVVGGKKKEQKGKGTKAGQAKVQAASAGSQVGTGTSMIGPTSTATPTTTGLGSASRTVKDGCPICGNDLVVGHGTQQTCTVCDWDTQRVTPSSVFVCSEHGKKLYFDHTIPPRRPGHGYAYLCLGCAQEMNIRSVDAYLRMGGMSTKLIVRKPEPNGSDNK